MWTRQSGAALMLMLVILMVGTLSLLVSSLGQAGLQNAKNRKTSEALAQAKEALIAYAVSNRTRPGNLPCPDLKAPGQGTQDSCSGIANSIGRLPWKTLGIAELVDADGEPLWYVLSGNFKSVSSIINSDTQGTSSVYDNSGTTLLSSDVAAIVFAPGSTIGSQSRSASINELCTSTSTIKFQNLCATNYLDTGPNSLNNSAAAGPFIAANKTATFNDRLIYITTENLFATIEKLVSKNIESGIKAMLNTYASSAVWGAYPFAAPFVRPSTSTFNGQAGLNSGLLPIGNIDPGTILSPLWKSTPTPTYAVSGGGESGNCTIDTSRNSLKCACSGAGCEMPIPAGGTLTLNADIAGVGLGLWKMFDKGNIDQVAFEGGGVGGKKLWTDPVLNLASVNLVGHLHADGSAGVILTATAKSGGSDLKFIEMKGMESSSTFPLALWLLPNKWHQHMYYAISPTSGLQINGSGSNKQAIVVMMGKALAGKTHSTAIVADYMEGENATPADLIYVNKTRSSTFNDQVIIVAP